ncbi:ANTAR domain-containing protein [Streptomyces silvensis]|uniref:ANTAR domain-containing protein n=1 Tax=Streptomyces silvensis TaxID=1765722 RepID=UPI000A45CCBB|nr:ANTAR domain-containing protein [Streptomyces silvensis]
MPREQLVRLEEEVDHLKQAVTSHATVDQAIGVILAVGQLTPAHGWDVLKEVSQNTNIKLRHIAELIVTWGRTGDLPSEVRSQLESSIDRRSGPSAEDGAAS